MSTQTCKTDSQVSSISSWRYISAMSLPKKSPTAGFAPSSKTASRILSSPQRREAPSKPFGQAKSGAGSAALIGSDVESLIQAVERLAQPDPRVVNQLRAEFTRLLAKPDSPRTDALIPAGDKVLTTQEAADMVGVSRPFMAARIDAGELPLFQQVGNQRRVLASEVQAWHAKARDQRRTAMVDLVQDLDSEYDS